MNINVRELSTREVICKVLGDEASEILEGLLEIFIQKNKDLFDARGQKVIQEIDETNQDLDAIVKTLEGAIDSLAENLVRTPVAMKMRNSIMVDLTKAKEIAAKLISAQQEMRSITLRGKFPEIFFED